ncbi:MAG: hypothetical protein KAS72_07280 [Phycisphaerales bacterium]|nr:hypothetical protein [Phycisphaerales bacterium]
MNRHTRSHAVCSELVIDPAVARRARRVVVLLLITISLSLFDLILTLTYVRSIGMAEVNPIAAWILREGSTSALVAWKLGSVLMAATIIYAIRHKRQAERAAWLAVIILGALTAHWMHYGASLHQLTPVAHALPEMSDYNWIVVVD